jgi:large subunit ribosomal protein L13
MIYLDAKNQILGRLSSKIAKMILSGETVYVVNAEKAVVLGNPAAIKKSFREKRDRGDPYHGPFYPKRPDMIIRRTVRGMIPYTTERGREAFKRLRVFISIPDELRNKQFTELSGTGNRGECKSIALDKMTGSA